MSHTLETRKTPILIVDGLDELASPNCLARLGESLSSFRRLAPQCSVVVTCRSQSFRVVSEHLPQEFAPFALRELSSSQQSTLLDTLTRAHGFSGSAATELRREIRASAQTTQLATNPFLLSGMALARKTFGSLPRSKALLYGLIIRALSQALPPPVPSLPRIDATSLERVALMMCDQGVVALEKEAFVAMIRNASADIRSLEENVLLAAAAQTGLFADVGTSLRFGIPVAVYQFWHRVFQEFLAARAVLDGSCQDCVSGSDPVERITTITRDANWTPSFLDYDLNESWQEPVALCIALLEVPEAESALLAVAGESIENPRLALARTAFSIMNIDRGRDISETCVSVLVGRLAQLAAKISEIDVPVAFYFSCFHIAESRWCSILTEALAGSYTSATWVGRKAASTLLTGLSVPKEVREVIKGVLLRSTRSVGADTDGERQNQFIRLAFVDIQELSGRLFSNPPLPIGNPRLSLSDILDWIGSDPSTNELALWLVELLSKGGRGNDLVAHRDRSLPVFYQMVREHRLHSNGALHSVVEAFRIANDVRGVDLATEVLKQPEDFFRGDGLLRNTAKRAMEDLSSIISA